MKTVYLNKENMRKHVLDFIKDFDLDKQDHMHIIHEEMHAKISVGSQYLGWLDLPLRTSEFNLEEILDVVNVLQKKAKILVVIGIGGSYLGTKAALDFLEVPFKEQDYQIIFAGHHLSETYLANLLDYLKEREFCINVISKSGSTIEPAIAFRLLKDLLEKQQGIVEAKSRIVVTTDQKEGSLLTLATKQGYQKFIIPSDVGGRFSVLTPAGLLPLAFIGYNIGQLINGAKKACEELNTPLSSENDAYKYAFLRYLLSKNGYAIELFGGYDPRLLALNEWLKQLFAESEGKNKKGLFVSSASYSTDLHSLGQYIQDGQRILFETIINIEKKEDKLIISNDEDNFDNLNYLQGKSICHINQQAFLGTTEAHIIGDVPNIEIIIKDFSEYTLGYLFYFFQKSCAMSAYLNDINPFDQPGVEQYKKSMFRLLKKPGY